MIERLLHFAIDKPILNHILLLFLLILSVFAYQNIPKEIFPPASMDKLVITGGYAGTSADLLDKMVVHTIEDGLKNLSGIDTVESIIKNGAFSISADIKPGQSSSLVLDEVKDTLSSVRRDLPADMDEPVAKVAERSFPLVLIAVAGDVEKRKLLDAADAIKSELSLIKDLSDIVIRGDADDELLIRLKPERIEAYGLQQSSVVNALSQLSSIFPVGTIKQRGEHRYISTFNGIKEKTTLENSLIRAENKTLYLKEIADVFFTLSDPNELSHFNGVPNVSISVSKSDRGNAIALSQSIRTMLGGYAKRYPDLEFKVYTDTSIWIKNRLNTVVSNIVFGLGLVFLSMLLFINARIALIVAIGIPVSFMIGLVATEILGYSLNMLTLLGGLIALGMLVDEAIVVGENIYRHMEEGMDSRRAALQGAKEMFPAVLTATLTTVFAFLPLLLLSGSLGEFIKVLPVMITILLLSSLLEAFFFLPLHAKDLLKVSDEGGFSRRFWKFNEKIYRRILSPMLHRKYLATTLLVGLIVAVTLVLARQSKFQLFPTFDTTQIYISGSVDINNELEDTEAIITRLEKRLLERVSPEEVDSITSVIGMKLDSQNQPESAENMFHVFVNLHEPEPDNFYNRYINPWLSPEYDDSDMIRGRSAQQIAAELQNILEPLRHETVRFESGREAPLFDELNVVVPQAGVVKSDIEISVAINDSTLLSDALDRIKEALHSVVGVVNITDDAKTGEEELKLRVNAYGQQLGMTEGYLNGALKPFYLKSEYGKMFNDQGLVRIRLEDPQKDRLDLFGLTKIQVPGSGQWVRLDEVADFVSKPTYAKIYKEDGRRIRTVYASLEREKVTSAEVMAHLSPLFKTLRQSGVDIQIKGEQEENERVQREVIQSAVIALFLIFVTLVWLFDSIVKPLIVISTIPLSILGVLLGHLLMGLNITMPSLIGMVGLAGVVVNDGLIMTDFIKGSKDTKTLFARAALRLRPILLTSLTTVLGLSTLIFFAAGQSLILQPMAVTLGFGLIWATVLNLYYVPLIYSIIYRVNTP